MNRKPRFAFLGVFLAATTCWLPRDATAVGIVTFGSPAGTVFSVTDVGPAAPSVGALTVFYNNPVVALAGATEETVPITSAVASSSAGLWTFSLAPSAATHFGDSGLGSQASLGIDSILIDLLPGNGAFDRTLPNPGTPNSLNGLDFTLGSFVGLWDLTVTYLNPLAVGAAAPVGDLYGALRIDFSSPFDASDDLTFGVDTDVVIGTPVGRTPEPGALLLMGLGMSAMLLSRRRGRQDRRHSR